MKMPHEPQIKLTPLGGVGEIGALNCMVYETPHEAIIVDCGSQFPDENTFGVDLIIPDFSYLEKIRHKLVGLVLTHGHEDHIGSSAYFLKEFNIPVYGSAFTLGLVEKKIAEHTLNYKPKFHTFKVGTTLHVGSFEIETIHVNHSIIGACGLGIKTPQGYLVHLTDWKIDRKPVDEKICDLDKMGKLGKAGVLAMLCDSTNAAHSGATLSEREVIKQIKKISSRHKGRIIITLFSSNIRRVQLLARLADELGRKLAFVGRSMKENTELARAIDELNLDQIHLVDVEEMNKFPDHQVMLLVTGTQGEQRSVLSRIATNAFKPFKIKQEDLILFSSKMIPGNEKNIYSVINNLSRLGAKIMYESIHEIHTSGHAHEDEIVAAYSKLKPKYYIPIHGDYHHLRKNAELIERQRHKKENILLFENGQQVFFENRQAFYGDEIAIGKTYVEGQLPGDVDRSVMRDRRVLSETGAVVCSIVVDKKTKKVIDGPQIITKGVISDSSSLVLRAAKAVNHTIDDLKPEIKKDLAKFTEEVRLSLVRFFRRERDKKPVIIPIINEI